MSNMYTNPMQMILEFNRFRQGFSGDPRQAVQNLLNSGQMSQQQYNQLQGMANQFVQMLQTFKM